MKYEELVARIQDLEIANQKYKYYCLKNDNNQANKQMQIINELENKLLNAYVSINNELKKALIRGIKNIK